MERIAGFLLRMLPAMGAAVPAVAVLRLVWLGRLKRRGLASTFWHEAGLWAFFLFIAGLGAITVIPLGWRWMAPDWSRVNLVPFQVLRDCWARYRTGDGMYFVINILGNIVMFLPFGFFSCLLWGERGRGLRRGTLAALGASLLVELCQLPQNRGADVDDLWLNALGGALGYGVYWMVKKGWPGAAERFRVQKNAGGEPPGDGRGPGGRKPGAPMATQKTEE